MRPARADSTLPWFCEARGAEAGPSVLVVAAHADDETIGAGARIAAMAPACHVVHLTDGAPVDRGFFPAPLRGLSRSEYARARRVESARALAVAGLNASRVRCFDVRDRELCFEMVWAARRLAALLVELAPRVVLTHAYEGGHPDHDAAAFVVHASAALARARGLQSLSILEMTGYHDSAGATARGAFLPWKADAEEITVLLGEEERTTKKEMLAAYVSQREVLAPFGVKAERFRVAPPYDFSVAPHGGPLHYERFAFGMPGAEWRALARVASERLALPEVRP